MSFMYFLNILTLHLCLVPNIIFASDFSALKSSSIDFSWPLPGAERWPGRSAKLPPNPGLVEEWNTWDSWDLQSDFEFISSRVHYDIVSESYPSIQPWELLDFVFCLNPCNSPILQPAKGKVSRNAWHEWEKQSPNGEGCFFFRRGQCPRTFLVTFLCYDRTHKGPILPCAMPCEPCALVRWSRVVCPRTRPPEPRCESADGRTRWWGADDVHVKPRRVAKEPESCHPTNSNNRVRRLITLPKAHKRRYCNVASCYIYKNKIKSCVFRM